jgi:hypothetical protein
LGKNWWKLEAGTEIPQELELVNNHWLWKPSKMMPIDEYKTGLQQIGASFSKVS